MDTIELLKRLIDNNEKEIFPIILQKYIKTKNLSFLSSLYSIEEYRALKSIYIDQNILQAKQHFYICGRLDLYLINNHHAAIRPARLVNALLSDNSTVINDYTRLKRKKTELDSLSFNAMHSILNNNMNALARDIEITEKAIKRSRNFWVRFYELCKEYYKGVLENDKTKVEEAIIQLVEPKFQKKRARKDIVNVLDFHGVGFAKLAWLRGLKIEINSPLVPQELLPFKPNKEYTMPYDFLEDNFI